VRKHHIALLLLAAGFGWFLSWVHPFLAINRPVAANILVVEGWVAPHVLNEAANEFRSGAYERLFVSGLKLGTAKAGSLGESDAERASRYLATQGIAKELIVPCPAEPPWFNRTSHMARAVRDQMKTFGVHPRGVNVVTVGPHGRQTLLAYRRMIDPAVPVGVLTFPTNTYNPSHWWATSAGIVKTGKDFAGWLKEVVFGLRA